MQPKSVLPTPPPISFWQRLSFKRRFEFTTKMSPEDYVRAVEKVSHAGGEFLLADRYDIDLKPLSESATPFTITLRKQAKYNFYILSRAKGEIRYNPEKGQTLVTGSAAFYTPVGVVASFGTMVALLLLGLAGEESLCFIPFSIVMLGIMIGGAYYDRSSLVNILGDIAVLGPKRHRNKSKRK